MADEGYFVEAVRHDAFPSLFVVIRVAAAAAPLASPRMGCASGKLPSQGPVERKEN